MRPEKQAILLRRMLIIRHKHSQVGWWGVRKNSVKLKKQVLMEFGGWSLPPWPKSLIGNRFPCSTRRFFTRSVDTSGQHSEKYPLRLAAPEQKIGDPFQAEVDASTPNTERPNHYRIPKLILSSRWLRFPRGPHSPDYACPSHAPRVRKPENLAQCYPSWR